MGEQNDLVKRLAEISNAQLKPREALDKDIKTDEELNYGPGLSGTRAFEFLSPGVYLYNGKVSKHCVGKVMLTCDEHWQVMAILTTRVEQDTRNIFGQDDVNHFGKFASAALMAMRPSSQGGGLF